MFEPKKRYGQYENLSLLASAIHRLGEKTTAEHEEIDAMYAPSELHGLVQHGYEIEIVKVLVTAEMTPNELGAELEKRTSSRWTHFRFPIYLGHISAETFRLIAYRAAQDSSTPAWFGIKAGMIVQRMLNEEEMERRHPKFRAGSVTHSEVSVKPTREEIETAMRDGENEGCPYDAAELAAAFNISVEELEEILEGAA